MQNNDGEQVCIYFVVPANCESKDDCESEMLATFHLCAGIVENCKWVTEPEMKKLTKTKQDVIVLQNFDGDLFESLTKEKSVIVGYRCLKKCLMNKIQIPNYSSPVFNMAMANLVVCVTGLRPNEKKLVKDKIGYMGGKYTAIFTTTTTHLITDCVNSVKYAAAVELKIPIYLLSWVDDVWKQNLVEEISATDASFNVHKCKPFHNLNITTTGLTGKEREDLSKLVNENGGEYSGKLSSGITSVLICKSSGAKSEKFRAAKKFNIECCSKEWVYDSIKAGYAVPFKNYQILDKDVASSTLINQSSQPTGNLNFSMASTIQGDSPRDVSESLINMSNISTVSNFNSRPSEILPNKLETVMKKFPDLKEIKKSGTFLDGCCLYLGGFEGTHRDKLCKILNLGGAIRMDEISDNVTHLIAFDWRSSEIDKFHQEGFYPLVLSVEWILESIKLKCPAPEDDFKLYPVVSPVQKDKNDRTAKPPSSPLSQKGVQMLRHNSSLNISKFVPEKPEEKKVESEPSDTENFMREYAEKQGTETDTLDMFMAGANFTDKPKEVTKTEESKQVEEEPKEAPTLLPLEESKQDDDEELNESNLFKGLKFTLMNWEDECQITDMIEESGGTIHTKTWRTDPPDYIIVPTDGGDISDLPSRIPVLTYTWIEECLSELKLLPIAYYHKPITMSDPDAVPLQGCYVAVTSYKGFERSFLSWLIEYLGANFAEVMSRANNTKKLPATTHLVSPTPLGSKYNAAVLWGIPIITHDWLLACAQESRRVPEHIFAVKSDNTPIKLATPKLNNTPKSSPKNDFKTPTEIENKAPNIDPKSTPHLPKITRMDTLNAPIGVSPPRTPILKFFENIGLSKSDTPDNSPLPNTPSHVDTPNTPLGRCFGEDDPETRKNWARRINALPNYHHSTSPPNKRPRLSSTPISELKEQLWNKILPKTMVNGGTAESADENGSNSSSSRPSTPTTDTPSKNALANLQVEQLREIAQRSAGRSGSRLSIKRADERCLNEAPPVRLSSAPIVIESQQGPIGWEDPLEEDFSNSSFRKSLPIRRFMLTQLKTEDRQRIVDSIESLGGLMSEQTSLYDDQSTHLICPLITRNEKILASIASGKWILHVSYIVDSSKAGEFLDEELYEFGNPKARLSNCDLGKFTNLAVAGHRWRIKIGQTGLKAYDGMKAILFDTAKKDQVVRLIEAGGGKIVPQDDIEATHCFVEPKAINNYPECRKLSSQGVFCLAPVYLNNYLLETELDPQKDIIPAVLPFFKSK